MLKTILVTYMYLPNLVAIISVVSEKKIEIWKHGKSQLMQMTTTTDVKWWQQINSFLNDHLFGVMVIMVTLIAVDYGFDPRSDQTKDY